jgi:hypothetical protein
MPPSVSKMFCCVVFDGGSVEHVHLVDVGGAAGVTDRFGDAVEAFVRNSSHENVPTPEETPALMLDGTQFELLRVNGVEQSLPAHALTIDPPRLRRELARVESEPMGPALDHSHDDAGLLEQLQVSGDRGLRHAEIPSGGADRQRSLAQPLDDPTTDRVRES